jgi:hypothetical protein
LFLLSEKQVRLALNFSKKLWVVTLVDTSKRNAHYLYLIILMLPLSFIAGAAKSPFTPLPMGKGLPSSFRDVSIESRCDALAAYVRDFATAHLSGEQPKTSLQDVSCGEGNGLGGARYSYDFKLTKGEEAHTYRLDVGFTAKKGSKEKNSKDDMAFLRLCDLETPPLVCSINHANQTLKFENNKERFKTQAKAAQAAKLFYDFHPHMSHLLPTLDRWIKGKQTQKKIYGLDYADFITKIQNHKDGFPITNDEVNGIVKFTLEPPNKNHASTSGRVNFSGPVPASFLNCFKCPDVACLNSEVLYRFEDRLFSLTRSIASPESKAKKTRSIDMNYGVGWIIQGLDPLGKNSQPWKYVCGVSRYSLQNVNL